MSPDNTIHLQSQLAVYKLGSVPNTYQEHQIKENHPKAQTDWARILMFNLPAQWRDVENHAKRRKYNVCKIHHDEDSSCWFLNILQVIPALEVERLLQQKKEVQQKPESDRGFEVTQFRPYCALTKVTKLIIKPIADSLVNNGSTLRCREEKILINTAPSCFGAWSFRREHWHWQ